MKAWEVTYMGDNGIHGAPIRLRGYTLDITNIELMKEGGYKWD